PPGVVDSGDVAGSGSHSPGVSKPSTGSSGEYANGVATDASSEQPASQSAGQQDAAMSGKQNSGTDSSMEYTATVSKDSQSTDPNNAAGKVMQAMYANFGDSSSGQEYMTAGGAHEYQAYPMSVPDYHVTKP